MIVLALLGAGFGLGAWILWRAIAPRPRTLAAITRTLDDVGSSTGFGGKPAPALVRQLAWWAVGRIGAGGGGSAQLFALTGRTPERHAVDKLACAIGGVVLVALTAAAAGIVGFAFPLALVVAIMVGAAVGGFLLPDGLLRDEAERRRRAFRHALSSYLDLVNVILAGGGGIETALNAAGEAGDGWAFAAIRQALDRARLTNRTPWDMFAQLGRDLGVSELTELAASVSLAGSQGARIRRSLAAKADSLRAHQVAETETNAESATERMTIPVAVLLFGFLVFVAYPAIHQITTVTNTRLP